MEEMQAVAADVRGGASAQCGHFLADERPEVFTQQLLDFFTEQK